MFILLIIPLPHISTRTDTLFPYTTLVRSGAYLNTELDFYAGYSREIMPGVTADVDLLYYFYPKDGNAATDFFEPYASLSGSLGPVNAQVGLPYAWAGQHALGNDAAISAYKDLRTAVPGTPFKLQDPVGSPDGHLHPPP